MKKVFKSIGAFVAAVFAVVVLSYGTDFLLQAAGAFTVSRGLSDVSAALIITIILYRNMYNVLGGYIVARLAPARPVGHALALGTFGFVGSLGTTIATWNMNLAPAWYSFAIMLLALPSAWAGGKLYMRSKRAVSVRANPRTCLTTAST